MMRPIVVRIKVWKSVAEVSLPCKMCLETFADEGALEYHFLKHSREHYDAESKERYHVCEVCGKTFRYISELVQHLRSRNAEQPPMREYCVFRKITARKSFPSRNRPTNTGHPLVHTSRKERDTWDSVNEERSQCPQNYQSNARSSNLLLTQISSRLHQCHECNKTVKQKSTLATHMLDHTKERMHQCENCEDNNSVDGNSVGCDEAAFRTTSASTEVTLPTTTEPSSILPGSTDGQPLLHSLSQVEQHNPTVSSPKANNSVAERSSADDEVALPITSAACELNSPTTTEPSSSLPRSTDDGQSLLDFLSQVEEYNPTIPDPVTAYFLNTSGSAASDPRIIRLISLAAQKFVSDVANDAFHHCKLRGAGQSIQNSEDKRYVMTMEDLGPALTQYGINANKPRYFT